MTTVQAWCFAGYLAWLATGTLDFLQHRRTGLAQTSGLRETALHGVQLGLLGLAVLAWLALAPTLALLALLATLVALHAVAGYADTLSAFGRRSIPPLEQHVHSVLDMAPWIALAVVVVPALPGARAAGWAVAWQPAPSGLWLAALIPPLLLCVVPWLAEWRAAWRARGG